MANLVTEQKRTWQPFTFRGVAGYSRASVFQVLLLEIIMAVVTTISLAWFFAIAWAPVIQETLSRLPEKAVIRQGALDWSGPAYAVLGKGPLLAIIVDLEENQQRGQLADLQCELGRSGVKFRSLLGYSRLNYPVSLTIPVNRIEWESWWGAWRPFALVGSGLVVSVGLLLIWWLLAALYALPIRILARLLSRRVAWGGCWKLAGAALMPGALWLTAAVVLYGLRQLELVGVLFAFIIHFLIGWFYVVLAPTLLPPAPACPKTPANPFARPENGTG